MRRDQRSAQAGKRLRGRKAVAQRKRRLDKEPLCRMCSAEGRVTAAVTPDHILPLAKGGADTEDNVRCLCRECHLKVTAQQFGYRQKQTVDVDGWPVE